MIGFQRQSSKQIVSNYFQNIVQSTINGNVHEIQQAFEAEKNSSILLGSSFSFPPPPRLSRNSKEIVPCKEVSLLHIAAYYDNLEAFLFLLSKGIPLRIASGAGYLPLHYACVGNAKEVVAYILKMDPEQASLELEVVYPLINLAIYANSPEILKKLFKFGANLQSPKNISAKPFDQALRSKNFDCLLILLQGRCRTDVTVAELNPLMLAVVNGMTEAIEPLIQRGISPYEVNSKGDTALTCACTMENVEIVKLLCKNMNAIEVKTNGNKPSVAYYAVRSGNLEILKTVLDKGCTLDKFDAKGKTALHALTVVNDQDTANEMLKLLIQYGININNRYNSDSYRFLEDLVINYTVKDYSTLVETLLQNNADPKLKMPDGKTLLTFVSKYKGSNNQRESKYYSIFKRFYPELQ